jgi:hypothetical protein
MYEEEETSCLDLEGNRRLTDKEVQELIKNYVERKTLLNFKN